MNWVSDNRGSILLTVAAVLLGVFIGVFLYQSGNRAEAVIGGIGNVTDGNNLHNLSASATHGHTQATTVQRVCIFCHTPHGAIQNAALINGPLWNHSLSEVTSYVYNMPSKLTTALNPADGASRMCLSCHDGTVAIGNTVTQSIAVTGACIDTDGSFTDTCSVNLGTSITHHIFSIPVNDDLITNSLALCLNGTTTTRVKYPWTSTPTAPGQPNDVLLRPTAALYNSPGIDGDAARTQSGSPAYASNYSYGVQCSTCHDPHLYWEAAGSSCKFLVAGACATGPSGFDPLCLACHTSDCP